MNMDPNEFREFGNASIDFIINYLQNIRDRDVLPTTTPFSLVQSLPKNIPEQPEHWKTILHDLEHIILPDITHWQSPNFHAYYPCASSGGSIIGELLIAGIGAVGISWISSPACTELEIVVMDWLAKFLKLPEQFLYTTDGPGGGILQSSASESVLVAVIAAREQTVRRMKEKHPEMTESEIRGKLVAYSSDQSNSCIEKAGVLSAVPIRLLPTGDDYIFRGQMLQKALDDDLEKGLIPMMCIATLGTTGTCAFDDIEALGKICNKHDLWLHIDAAYGGAAFALEECSEMRNGLEMVDSLNFNLHKILMVNLDCSAMWLKDTNKLVDSLNVDRLYLKHKYDGQKQIPEFRHWQIPLGKRFRALKVWIAFRTVGAEGLRAHIRKHMALAERFENYVLSDPRFEVVAERNLGLVCFRPKGENKRTTDLLHNLTERKKIFMIQAKHGGKHFLRFVVCGIDPKPEDIDFAWREIQSQMDSVLEQEQELLIASAKSDITSIAKQITSDLRLI